MFAIAFFITLLSLASQAKVDPAINWQTIETQNFDLIFDARRQDLAIEYAKRSELNYQILTKIMPSAPHKTTVLLLDATDLPNGYATKIPYSSIVIFPVLPGPMDSIGEYGDWAREIHLHEYTHSLTFEPASGIVGALRFIMGSIISPNMLLPRWWIEGVAVDFETRYSNHGRLRSAYQDSLLRALHRAESLDRYSIAEINESTIPSWPRGARPYLFGSLLISEIIANKNPSVTNDIIQRQGARPPYWINSAATEFVGKNYYQLFNEAITNTKLRVELQWAQLQATTVSQSINTNGIESHGPSISPDGSKMTFISRDEIGQRAVQILQRKNLNKNFDGQQDQWSAIQGELESELGPHKDAPPSGGINRVSWFADSLSFVYDKTSAIDIYNTFSDLYIYDLKQKKSTRLTNRQRAREPAVSPDSKIVAFVQIAASETSLAVINLEDKSIKSIFKPGFLHRVSYPIFLNNEELVFSWRKPTGEENLYRLNIAEGAPVLILQDFSQTRMAHKSAQGLIFTSTKNGVPNLYLANANLDGAKPVTHLSTGAFGGEIDPTTETLYLTEMTEKGPQVRIVESENWKQTSTDLPVVQALFADRYSPSTESDLPAFSEKKIEKNMATKSAKANQTAPGSETTENNFTSGAYRASRYLWPKYWVPSLIFMDNGEIAFTAATANADPLEKHSYLLSAGWESLRQNHNFQGKYINSVTPIDLTLIAISSRSEPIINGNKLDELNTLVQLSHSQYYKNRPLSYGLGWEYAKRSTGSTDRQKSGPQALFSYGNYSMSQFQISPENGYGLLYTYAYYLPNQGAYSFERSSLDSVYYFSKYLPKRHAVMTKLRAVYTPQEIPSTDLVSSASLPLSANLLGRSILMRGYPSGSFIGKTMLNPTLEYRLPLHNLYRGSGTNPIFLKRLHGAFIVDYLKQEGFAYQLNKSYRRTPWSEDFASFGLEVKLDTTLGYAFPITWSYGIYHNELGSSAYLGIQL